MTVYPLLPTCHHQYTVGAADQPMIAFFALGYARRVVPQSSGTVYLQGTGDSVMTPYLTTVGTPIDGAWTAVGGTTTGTTPGMVVNVEA